MYLLVILLLLLLLLLLSLLLFMLLVLLFFIIVVNIITVIVVITITIITIECNLRLGRARDRGNEAGHVYDDIMSTCMIMCCITRPCEPSREMEARPPALGQGGFAFSL